MLNSSVGCAGGLLLLSWCLGTMRPSRRNSVRVVEVHARTCVSLQKWTTPSIAAISCNFSGRPMPQLGVQGSPVRGIIHRHLSPASRAATTIVYLASKAATHTLAGLGRCFVVSSGSWLFWIIQCCQTFHPATTYLAVCVVCRHLIAISSYVLQVPLQQTSHGWELRELLHGRNG